MTNLTPTDHLKAAGKATGTFYFKQFKVEDGQSTMKVGTDAVLLGAAVDVSDSKDILEIGTGSGVIALILAQKSRAKIEALEIDESSVEQARANVLNCPWQERIAIIHSSLQDFTRRSDQKYDLIVSNPPYFSRSLKSPKEKRNISRHDDSLTFAELLDCSAKLMTDSGSLWVILPAKEGDECIENQGAHQFFLHYAMKITSKEGKEYQRIILQLRKTPAEMVREQNLVMRNADHSFTKEYMELTKEFYIDF